MGGRFRGKVLGRAGAARRCAGEIRVAGGDPAGL